RGWPVHTAGGDARPAARPPRGRRTSTEDPEALLRFALDAGAQCGACSLQPLGDPFRLARLGEPGMAEVQREADELELGAGLTGTPDGHYAEVVAKRRVDRVVVTGVAKVEEDRPGALPA